MTGYTPPNGGSIVVNFTTPVYAYTPPNALAIVVNFTNFIVSLTGANWGPIFRLF